MIEQYSDGDMDAILEIWLQASIQAHHFIPAQFWQSQVENMRQIYLPASEVYVFRKQATIVGFYALHQETLAAIFVLPDYQRQGVGKQLLAHAKQQRKRLTLSVYQANQPSYQFYLSQGFEVVCRQRDAHTG